MTRQDHIPVMCDEVLEFLNPQKNKTYVDATFGQGGYSKQILSKTNCCVIGIDRDKEAKKYAKIIKKKFDSKFYFKNERFSNIEKIFKNKKVDGITFDLGMSNTQLSSGTRGFSFSNDGPLDMRMGMQKDKELTAQKIINNYTEKQLLNIFRKFGEERNSQKISKAIVSARKFRTITSTSELSRIINDVNTVGNQKKNPSTKIFQALRIFINEELLELENALKSCLKILNKKSKIIVVSFHSLEDKIVKKFFRQNSGYLTNNYKHLPSLEQTNYKPFFKLLTKKPIKPSIKEIKENPRARSAKLRAVEVI
tara:strand:+ start:919 stop:1848 length:930 start_codon:yes stop_codon:yes gene_type:complete